MLQHTFSLTVRDLLFFNDARPMGGSGEGSGARWPLPSVLHAAILSAFHERWPELDPAWESRHTRFTAKEERRRDNGKTPERSSLRFGGLRTMGPFPYVASDLSATHGGSDVPAGLYLPTPADLVPGGIMQPVQMSNGTVSNLPPPLKYPVSANVPPTKDTTEPWIRLAEFVRYLAGDATAKTTPTSDLYHAETRPGVGIDPTTHANREHVFYQAEYLRLRAGVSLVAWAQAEARRFGEKAGQGKDLLAEFTEAGLTLRLGGQGGIATATLHGNTAVTAPRPTPGALRLKWVLLSPALFTGGWCPGWLDADSGAIRLTVDKQPIAGRLVAARIPKPLIASGWKLDKNAGHAGGTPKATRLLVPAGAVYYFDLADAESARLFIQTLHLKPKSDELGEKGFGLGAVGIWNFVNP